MEVPIWYYGLLLNYFTSHSTLFLNNLFAADFSALVVGNKSTENVVYSPLSIHISLALMLTGAADHTESELKNALRLGKEPKENLIIKYGFFLNNTFETRPYGPQLSVANRLFVNNKVKILKKFRDIASFYFKSQMENMDFCQPLRASVRIYDWLRQQRESNTKELSHCQTLSSDADAVWANAIYFKPIWKLHFFLDTKKRDFYTSPSKKVSVDTMFTRFRFPYAELSTLNARALELPYNDQNTSMLIILPNEIDGLEKLEKNLKGMDLNIITSQMKVKRVNVYLPKFRIESEVDLKEPLKKMGCASMFENANFSNMLGGSVSDRKTLDIKQKTIIDCNQKGERKVFIETKHVAEKEFRADHPFVFIIRTKTMVLFYGHVAKF